MTFDVDYQSTFEVIDSWEQIRRLEDYEDVVGRMVFQRIFEKSPELKTLFGFPIDLDPSSPKVQKSTRFTTHSRFMVQMLDKTLNCLGPDVELLSEILMFSAKKHIRFGMEVEHFGCMSEVLMETLSELFQERFTPTLRNSWRNILDAITTEMMKSMNQEKKVFQSWEKLKKVDKYREVAGSVLFQSIFKKCPEAKAPFGIPDFADASLEALRSSPTFKVHSVNFINMLDRALGMLEAKGLAVEMGRLGAMHAKMGITQAMFDSLGEALLEMLQKLLPKSDWDTETREAWSLVYSKLSTQMIKAMV